MELKELTIKDLKQKQIVVVEFMDKHCLTFLVWDVESPSVPGFPACSLSSYNNLKQARKEIKRIYKKVGYTPKFNCGFTNVWRTR